MDINYLRLWVYKKKRQGQYYCDYNLLHQLSYFSHFHAYIYKYQIINNMTRLNIVFLTNNLLHVLFIIEEIVFNVYLHHSAWSLPQSSAVKSQLVWRKWKTLCEVPPLWKTVLCDSLHSCRSGSKFLCQCQKPFNHPNWKFCSPKKLLKTFANNKWFWRKYSSTSDC